MAELLTVEELRMEYREKAFPAVHGGIDEVKGSERCVF
jgi:hypothetical protein